MAMHTLPPTFPGDWIASLMIPPGDGTYMSYIIVRSLLTDPDYQQFVCSLACYVDEGPSIGWRYCRGEYTQSRDEVMRIFADRIRCYMPKAT